MAAPFKLHAALTQTLRGTVNRAAAVISSQKFNTSAIEKTLAEQYLQATEAKHPKRSLCRTPESNTKKHTLAHEGLFYTIPKDDAQQWLSKAFRIDYQHLMKAFQETTLMVRAPAVEILECLQTANYHLPTIRYVLYGHEGNGKTNTLGHIIHHCGQAGWLILQVPWAAHWNRYFGESQVSSYNSERYDLPVDGMEWLNFFKKMNEPLLKELNLTVTNKYIWNKRESSDVGAPLTDAIDFGISRPKYACDVVGAVLKEIRLQAASRGFKVLVAIDGVNAFWEDSMVKRTEDRSFVNAQHLSLVHNFKKMLRNDWTGGAVVCTVDVKASPNYANKANFMPKALLHQEGFEWLDPFIPVHVPGYSDKEAHSCLDYFTERKWIQNPKGLTDEGRKEIIFLSCKNPFEMYRVTRTW